MNGYSDDHNENRLILTDNSCNTPLSSNQIFTGVFRDISDYRTVKVFAVSDKDSALNGLEVHFSTDGIAIDMVKRYTLLANVPLVASLSVITRYMRIKYTNGFASGFCG